MVQPIDFNKPVYSAVNISIRKPEVEAGAKKDNATNPMSVNNDNGIYNAVKIDIDNPRVNTQPKAIYDYPEAEEVVTYGMLNINPVALPVEDTEAEEIEEEEIPAEQEEVIEVPAQNYTTVEAEKEDLAEKKTPDVTQLSFRGTAADVQKPEIIPSEHIIPKVDIALITENLSSKDRDVQAQQIEEIVRTAIMDSENAKNYLVSDVFAKLIDITKEDATRLAPPTQQQTEIRQKIIANILAIEKNPNAVNNLPYKLTDEEMAIATNLSPMELAERNKEYAITALGTLAKLFIDDFEAKEGRVVPITDAPGVSAIVNALRKDPDSSVKLAAIDALRYIKRPEYKDELSAIVTLAQTDPNPNVARAAAIALKEF